MKKLIFFIAFGLLGVAANAQVYNMTSIYSQNSDTVVNTASEVLTKQINGVYSEVTVQVVVTKISGTVAGTVVLQGSIDGTNYVTLNHLAQPAANDTVTNTNVASQSWIWAIGTSKYIYYRVLATGSGTMSATISAKIMVRKP